MNKLKKVNEAIGDVSERYLEEALEYGMKKPERKFTKKLIVSLAAAVLLLVCITVPAVAGDFYMHRLIEPFKPENAVLINTDDISIEAVEMGNTVEFRIKALREDFPYGELYINNFGVFGKWGESFGCSATNPYYGNYGEMSGEYSGGGLTVRDEVRKLPDGGYVTVLTKLPTDGKYAKEADYTFIVGGLVGKDADGNIYELRGVWKVKFRF